MSANWKILILQMQLVTSRELGKWNMVRSATRYCYRVATVRTINSPIPVQAYIGIGEHRQD